MKMLGMMNHCGFVVDKTLPSPYLLEPYRLKSDAAMHSVVMKVLGFYPELPTRRQALFGESNFKRFMAYDKHNQVDFHEMRGLSQKRLRIVATHHCRPGQTLSA